MSVKSLADLRIGIVGASVAGLAAARFLSERGARVELFERSQGTLQERGGGIALDQHLASMIGIERGYPASGRIVISTRGSVLWCRPLKKIMTAWSEVYRALAAYSRECPPHTGCRVIHCESIADGATITLEDGSSRTFHLVIGADGVGSTVRHAVMPDFTPEYLGYVAIRGQVAEGGLPGECASLHKWLNDPGLVNFYGSRTHAVAYWIPGCDQKILNWMWYRNVEPHVLAEFLSDEQGRSHRWSLPPGSMPVGRRTQLLEEMRVLFPESISAAAEATAHLYVQAIYRGVPNHFQHDNIVLIGDAAHIAVPHIGAGTSYAIRDAVTLAEGLNPRTIRTSLVDWARRQRESIVRDLAIATELGRSLQHQDHQWESWHERDFENWWNTITDHHSFYFDTPGD